jgi:hypothetical protein
MFKAFRAIFTFYLNHFFTGLCLTLCSIWLFDVFGIAALTIICWFKGITMAIIYFVVSDYRKKQFFYYQNLGISKNFLWITTLGIDLVLFIVLMIFTHQLK